MGLVMGFVALANLSPILEPFLIEMVSVGLITAVQNSCVDISVFIVL